MTSTDRLTDAGCRIPIKAEDELADLKAAAWGVVAARLANDPEALTIAIARLEARL